MPKIPKRQNRKPASKNKIIYGLGFGQDSLDGHQNLTPKRVSRQSHENKALAHEGAFARGLRGSLWDGDTMDIIAGEDLQRAGRSRAKRGSKKNQESSNKRLVRLADAASEPAYDATKKVKMPKKPKKKATTPEAKWKKKMKGGSRGGIGGGGMKHGPFLKGGAIDILD